MIRSRRDKPRRSSRERNRPFMLWVKTLPCLMVHHGDCVGVVEADHDNRGRGMSQKSSDSKTWPLCTGHHRQRTDSSGHFRFFDKAKMHSWCDAALLDTQMRFRRAFPTARIWQDWVERCEGAA